MKETPVEVEGVIHTVLPGTMFRVELDNKHLVLSVNLRQDAQTLGAPHRW